jgi:hypothetical protein
VPGLQIPIFGGRLKIRRRSLARTAEITHRLPTLDLRVVVISWWNKEALERDRREFSHQGGR